MGDGGLPGGVGVFVECTPAPLGPDDQPSAVWPVGPEEGEQVAPETGGWPVCCVVCTSSFFGGWRLVGDGEGHFLDKGPVEEV